MISTLRGRLVEHEGSEGTIEVRDVGYSVIAPRRSLRKWQGVANLRVFVVTEVTEGYIQLYGFDSADEKRVFRMLCDAAGLDSRIALAVLDAFEVAELRQVIESQDIMALTMVPGVGREVAQGMVRSLALGLPTQPTEWDDTTETGEYFMPDEDENTVIVAMARMGYKRSEIQKVQAKLGQQVDITAPIAERLQAAIEILHGEGD